MYFKLPYFIRINKKILVVPLFFILVVCASCGYVAHNIHIGPPEREIKKLYKLAESIYNEILDGNAANTPQNWDKAIGRFKEIAESYPNSRYADDAQYSCYTARRCGTEIHTGLLKVGNSQACVTPINTINRGKLFQEAGDGHNFRRYRIPSLSLQTDAWSQTSGAKISKG